MCAGASDGTISTQVLAEFWVTVTRKMKTPISTRSAREQIALFGAFHVLPVDHATVIEAIRIQESHKLSFWDAQIIASARLAKAAVIHSEDLRHGEEYEGVQVQNPFRT